MPLQLSASRVVVLCLTLLAAACSSEPEDDSPMGRAITTLMARPEHGADKVKVQHVLLAFAGAARSSGVKRTRSEARALAADVFARATQGEDFTELMKKYSDDDGGGTYEMTQISRKKMARRFADVSFRLQVGEVGVAAHQASKSPFGWHVIKRIE